MNLKLCYYTIVKQYLTSQPLQQTLWCSRSYLRDFTRVQSSAKSDVHVVGEERAVGPAGGQRGGGGAAGAARAQQLRERRALHALRQLARPARLLFHCGCDWF